MPHTIRNRIKFSIEALKVLPPATAGGTKVFRWDLEIPGFGAYRTSRGRITFVLQYRMRGGGKPQRYTIGTLGAFTIQAARDRARVLAAAIACGTDPIADEREKRRKTAGAEGLRLGRYFETFLVEREADGKPLSRSLRAAMINDVIPRFGERHMESISVDDLNKMKVALSARSKSAWRLAIEATKLVLNHAKRADRIARAATDKVPTPKSDRRSRAFSTFELRRYVEAISDIGGARRDAFLVIILLCRRLNEVAGMTWKEINQENWTWTLPKERTKNGKPLFLQLPRQVVDILKRQAPDPSMRHGFVFRHGGADAKHGIGIMETLVLDLLDANLDRRLDLWADCTGFVRPEFAHFNVHDGRTTVATMMQQKPLSIPPHVIEAVLHHVTKENGLLGVYQLYRYADEVGEALQRWADYVDALMAEPDAWPGGKIVPTLGVEERERRAANIRRDWSGRTRFYKASRTSKANSLGAVAKVPATPVPQPGRNSRRGVAKVVPAADGVRSKLHSRSVLAGHEDLLREIVSAQPDIGLEELKVALAGRGVVVSAVSTIHRCLTQLGITGTPVVRKGKGATHDAVARTRRPSSAA